MGQTYQYFPCPEMDYVLLQWLDRMRNDGELHKVISKGNHAPSSFLAFYQQPRQLFFQIDDLGNLKYACWVEPCMGSVFLSYYAQPAHRLNREVAHFIFDMFQMIFDAGIPSICGLIQERPTIEETKNFVKLHMKMGYEPAGKLPKFFDGTDCYLVAMTKEDWEEPKEDYLRKAKARWRKDRSKKALQEG